MMHDLINDAIVNIKNHERLGKSQCVVRPTSKLLIEILRIFQREGYIGEFELMEDKRGGQIRIKLVRKINDCGVIKPRFPVKHDEFPMWEKRYLPARDFGILVVTTPNGVMSHKEAKENMTGGRLLAYVY
jgi:small subunit ribosomal protein S8